MKESVASDDVCYIKWCPGSVQLANCITKRGAQSHLLLKVIQSGCMDLDGWNLDYCNTPD